MIRKFGNLKMTAFNLRLSALAVNVFFVHLFFLRVFVVQKTLAQNKTNR